MKTNSVFVNKHFLQKITKSFNKNRIKHATSKQIKSLCELCLNVYNRNIPVSSLRKRLLLPHKNILKALASKTKSIAKKKLIILQKGGAFLPILVPILTSVISALASKWLGD